MRRSFPRLADAPSPSDAPSRAPRQTADASLRLALPAGSSLLLFVHARAGAPHTLAAAAGLSSSSSSSAAARGGAAALLRTLRSGERERERAARAVAAAIARAGGPELVVEIWGVARLEKDGAATPAQAQADSGKVGAARGTAQAAVDIASLAVYRAIDNGIGREAVVVRSWPLAELRQIDGMGLSAETALEFALGFVGGDVFELQADSPRARARFLWGISQLFAKQVRRAPPTTGVLLLELQQVADDSGPPTVQVVDAPGKLRQRDLEADAFLDPDVTDFDESRESGEGDSEGDREFHADGDDMRRRSMRSEKSASSRRSARSGRSAASSRSRGSGRGRASGRSSFSGKGADDTEGSGSRSGRGSSGTGLAALRKIASGEQRRSRRRSRPGKEQADTLLGEKARSRAAKVPVTGQKIMRTVSEPSPTAVVAAAREKKSPRRMVQGGPNAGRGGHGKGSVEFEAGGRDLDLDGPVAMRPQPATAAGVGDVKNKKVSSAELRAMNIDQRAFLVAASRLGGITDEEGLSPTAVLMAKRKREAELRTYHMTSDETRDFDSVAESLSRRERCPDMGAFEEWLSTEIARLECANIEETSAVEQGAPAVFEPLLRLKDALSSTDGWFRKCEARLDPHACIVSEIRQRHHIMETQQESVKRLRDALASAIDTSSLTDSEQKSFDAVLSRLQIGVDSGKPLLVEDEFFRTSVCHAALGPVTLKSRVLDKDASICRNSALIASREAIVAQRKKLASLMWPSLTASAGSIASASMQATSGAVWRRERSQKKLEAFCTAAYALTVLDQSYGDRLITAYVDHSRRVASAAVISRTLREAWSEVDEKGLAAQLERVFDTIARLCTGEGSVALHMFRGVAAACKRPEREVVAAMLQELFANVANVVDEMVEAGNDAPSQWMAYLEVEGQLLDLEMNSTSAAAAAGAGSESYPAYVELQVSQMSLDEHLTKLKLLTQGARDGYDSRLFLVQFLRERATRYRQFVDLEISSNIATIPSRPEEMPDDSSGQTIFETVQSLVALCISLVHAWVTSSVGVAEISCMREKSICMAQQQQLLGVSSTKALCDRLAAAAMRAIESSSALCRRPDMVKLECYMYMSQYLGALADEHSSLVFADVLPLVRRGASHATTAWTGKYTRTYFGHIVDASRVPTSEVSSQIRDALRLHGGPRNVVNTLRDDVTHSLSSGARAASLHSSLWAKLVAHVHIALDEVADGLKLGGHDEAQAELNAYRSEMASEL